MSKSFKPDKPQQKDSMKQPSPKLLQMITEWNWLNEVLSRAKEVQGQGMLNGTSQQVQQERAALMVKDLH